jgi:hypothetical protein
MKNEYNNTDIKKENGGDYGLSYRIRHWKYNNQSGCFR